MEEKKKAMVNFRGDNNFEPFFHPAPLPGIQYELCENFTYFESTKVADNQLLEALRDERVYLIGVYGMGGSGKTTLVTEAGKKVESELFDKVIKITVSQTANIKDIQGEMAEKLDMKLEQVSEDVRAQHLWLSLKEKRILVIVDDLWTKFDLKHIGIRLDDNYKGKCKVLITTRNEHVCSSMKCQKKIHLEILSKDESWTLFKKYAIIDDDFSKSLDDRPREVCFECRGLPLAIETVGSSLIGKSDAADWEVALCSLSQQEVIHYDHVDEGVKHVLNCLKFSYDNLKKEEAELLFLICSMFPEDYNISTEDLIRYAVGVRQGARIPLKSARCFIEANINKLLQSCLLMHADKGKHYVKMHDLVRDTALWIGKRPENRKFLFSLDKPLRDLAEDDTIGDCFAISSWYNENQICKYDAQLKAPNLEILLLNAKNWSSLDLSDATFEETKELKVFAIINNHRYAWPSLLLPQSTQLTNLRTLRLNHWELGDISFIASLTRIEVLDLQNCRFNALPNDIEKLKGLKLLDLSNCHIEENYYGAIGKCLQLEELYLSGRSKYRCHQSIMDIITLPKLQRFIINNTENFTLDDVRKRALAVEDFNISNLGDSKKNLLQIADSVCLSRLSGGCKNIFPDIVGVVGSMNGLTTLLLHKCQEIECIFDTTSDSKIPGLVNLRLQSMENLKELCRGPPLQVLHLFEKLERLQTEDCGQLSIIFPRKCNLQNLKILTIKSCDSLGQNTTTAEVLFSTSVAQSLQQLKELTIGFCGELKHIVACEREHVSNASEEIVPTPSRSRFTMPSLKSIVISRCRKLESIFQIDCVEGQIELPRLEYMKLLSLENLIRICPENYGVKWPSLRDVYVNDCPKLSTSWIAMEQRQEHLNEQKQLLSTLKRLELRYLPQLNHIPCVGPTPGQILDLQCLQHLEIWKCENLKYLFSMAVIRSLPELIFLRIYDCEELEQIIVANEELVQLSNAEVYFPKLKDIEVSGCNKLESLFSVAMVRMLPQLSTISIWSATQLKEVYRQCSGDDTINEMEIVLPNMTKIGLYGLPSFVDICQGRKFKAEKLQELDISECPKTCPSLKAIQYFTYMGMPAVEGSSDKLEALLSQNITTEDIQLLLAASKGDKRKIEDLLYVGAKYDVKDIDGRTALDRANDEIKDFILNFSVSSSNTDEEGNS